MLVVLCSPTGALLAWASTPAGLPPIPSESIVVERPEWDAPPPDPYRWSPAALNWVVPTGTEVVSRLAFRWRYTLDEQVAIAQAETGDPDPVVRATLRVLRESLQEATEIRLTDPRTIQGVQYHVSRGLLTPERAEAILTP
jgi:hypothetical protein